MTGHDQPAATCPGCGRPVEECRAEDVDESFPERAGWLRLLGRRIYYHVFIGRRLQRLER